jgi:glycosyltransferase involved in cell wall biosynthesis
VRALQFFEELDLHGVSCHAAPLLTGEYLRHRFQGSIPFGAVAPAYARRIRDLVRARHFHAVWLEKELFPFLPAAFEGLERIADRPLLVDYDDAIFERYRGHSSAIVRGVLGGKIDHVMRRADVVTAGNEYIAAHARHAGAKHVEILPSVVDTVRYPVLQRPADAPFTIGWIGSPSTAPYLDLVRPVLERAVTELHARVRVIGGGAKALAGMAGVDRLHWHEATEGQDVAMIDVGIMPLADTPWERGKCGYKLVQYMAAARPVIASPVGVNATLVEHGKDGFLATTEDEWYMVGRAKAEQHYSVAAVAPRFASLLRGLVR